MITRLMDAAHTKIICMARARVNVPSKDHQAHLFVNVTHLNTMIVLGIGHDIVVTNNRKAHRICLNTITLLARDIIRTIMTRLGVSGMVILMLCTMSLLSLPERLRSKQNRRADKIRQS